MLKDVFKIDDDMASAPVGETAAILASPAETAAECRARARIYRMLSGVFIEEPSAEFLTAMRTPELLSQLAAADVRFDSDFIETPIERLVDDLAVEYTTLFAASGGFPPVESVRLYGRFKQEPNHETMSIYRRNGFELKPGRHEVFADQIGVELLFVAELLERAADAVESGDDKGFRRLEKEIKRFWSQHLGRWARGYGRLVERAAQHSFYRAMGKFLVGFAEEELAAMGLKVEDADQARLVVPKADIKLEFNPDEPECGGCSGGNAMGREMKVHTLHDLR